MTLPERTMIVTTKRDLPAGLYWCAIPILIWAMQLPVKAQSRVDGKEAGRVWAAVAPGVVEPRSGQIKIAASVVGRVSEVLVKINDEVATDEPLLRLDDEDAQGRVASAEAQVAMREKARNEKSAGKAANRRDAEDAVADAEATVVDARNTFDKAIHVKRSGSGSDATITSARTAWIRAQDNLERERYSFARSRDNPERRCRHNSKVNSMLPGPSFESRSRNSKN